MIVSRGHADAWWRAVIGLLIVIASAGPAKAAGRSYTVQQIAEAKSLPLGVEVQIEGRFQQAGRSAGGQTEFKLQRCEIAFRMDRALPAQPKGRNYAVTGKLSQEGGKTICEVQSLREVASDITQFRDRKRAIPRGDSKAMYELAEWAKQRGEFYTDVELISASDEASRDGLDIEVRSLGANDFEGRFRLAARAREIKLTDEHVWPLIHDGYRVRWKQAQQAKPAAWETLARDLARDLPGCDEPLSSPETELRKQYAAQPQELYRSTTAGVRRTLHRILYAEIVLRTLTSRLAPDSGNGFEIADEIEKKLPEFRAKAEEIRDKVLATRAADVNRLSRAQVLELAKLYRDRKQSPEAEKLLTKWLEQRRQRLDGDDIDGHLQLAEEYRALLNRADLSDKLLIETITKHPEARQVATRLEQLGYRWKDGRWLTMGEFQAQPEAAIEQAMRAGRVAIGMTAEQVRKTLGQPASKSRAVSAGQIGEVWIYGTAGDSRLAVFLHRKRNQAEAIVTQVSQ
jgi:hypothetical protein